jgi:hypothetical protein
MDNVGGAVFVFGNIADDDELKMGAGFAIVTLGGSASIYRVFGTNPGRDFGGYDL